MKRLIIFSIAAICAVCMVAQDGPALPKRVAVQRPEILNKPLLKLSELNSELCSATAWGQKRKKEDAYWVVYSDRADNVAYMEPSTSSQKAPTRMYFGQKVIIARIERDMALVYVDDRANTYPDIPSHAKSIGWVPMDKLLLWTSCPADDRGVLMKALIAINLNKMAQGQSIQGMLYKNPEISTNLERLSMDMNFYFRMKESPDGKFALLCLNSTFTGNNLYGWVDVSYFTPWNQRTCLEPNWNPDFVESHKNKKALIYINEKLADGDVVTTWQYGMPNGDSERTSQYRMKPAQLRFPILNKPDNNRVACTSFADRSGNSNMASAFAGNINEKINTLKHMFQHLNLIFVVEATTEMGKFLPAVKSSLDKCRELEANGMTVKAGLVLYGMTGQPVSNVVPLTSPSDTRLMSMLDPSYANVSPSGSNRDVAIADALSIAIDKGRMGFDSEESNLVVIVGNRGPSKSEMSLVNDQMLHNLAANNIQLMSVQVMRNEGGTTWAEFYDKVNELIKSNVEQQYRSIGADARFVLSRNGDGRSFRSTREGASTLFASTRFNKAMGQQLTPSAVTKYINDAVDGFNKSIQTKDAVYEQALNDIDFYPDFLIKLLGERGYKQWTQIKAISAYDGYARLQDNNGEDYWHYVLYISSGELDELVNKLKATSDAARLKSKDRTHYLNALKALLKAQLPEKKDREIMELTADDIQEAIYGLNVPTKSMSVKKYSIADLSNDKVVKDGEYQAYLNEFAQKYDDLRRIPATDYRYRMEVNNIFYYWIPIEDLP